jgi:hypothetical protein
MAIFQHRRSRQMPIHRHSSLFPLLSLDSPKAFGRYELLLGIKVYCIFALSKSIQLSTARFSVSPRQDPTLCCQMFHPKWPIFGPYVPVIFSTKFGTIQPHNGFNMHKATLVHIRDQAFNFEESVRIVEA